MSARSRYFPPISHCNVSGRDSQTIAADLDGTLLISRSSFPYFMLIAIEAGSFLRGLALLLASPVILVAYKFVSESLGIQLLIFISFAGLKIREIELASRAVLPRFYAADVRSESWNLFSNCRNKIVVTANPTVMVEPFVKDFLGGDKVLGTEIEVNPRTGRSTGFVKNPGVLVGPLKRSAILKEFDDNLPDLGIGDRESDHDFMELCTEGYMVPPDPSATQVPQECLRSPIIIHSGCLLLRPTPRNALLTFLWLPFGFILHLIQVYFNLPPSNGIIRYTSG
ncbi:PREDICTED: probable glycerol-3-phosphate acyltransferase 8 [Nelumbo nucifera]|uniref:Glycerol-3-phosphate acyltransferase RAM2/GPAT1-8 HAD-like domain-containing protein n=2 Tax=Nelumbo nucifera TaxID=4432 RepID=A0A822XIY3_NELNU|nr:PREDICTED: probable glycerol-3-phosphate acyltransferase 8 [Nelumbo nucifera]DAD18946.1 TPA_asm: hypothetical protein HUJ06_020409 [Nelumbo nucifera]